MWRSGRLWAARYAASCAVPGRWSRAERRRSLHHRHARPTEDCRAPPDAHNWSGLSMGLPVRHGQLSGNSEQRGQQRSRAPSSGAIQLVNRTGQSIPPRGGVGPMALYCGAGHARLDHPAFFGTHGSKLAISGSLNNARDRCGCGVVLAATILFDKSDRAPTWCKAPN